MRERPSTSATSPRNGARRIGVQLAADDVLALVGVQLDDPPRLESHLQPFHDLSVERERTGRAHDSLGPAAVGSGEDLFGGHVGDVGDAGRGHRLAPLPAGLGQEADGQIRAGPREPEPVDLELVERPCAVADPLHVRAPGRDGIVLVEPHAVLDHIPQAVDVGLAEHLPGPALVGHADDGPVVQLLVDLAVALVRELAHPRLADPLARQVGQELRLGISGQRHDRGVHRRRSRRRVRGARAASTTGCRRRRTRSGRGECADRCRRRPRSAHRLGRPRE